VERFRERGLINLLTVKYTKLFEKDYKLLKKRGLNLKLLKDIVAIFDNKQELPENYKNHYLNGKYKRI
jgi:addiction module toxin, relE/stbE family